MADDQAPTASPRNVYDNAGRQVLRGRRGNVLRHEEDRFKGASRRELRADDDIKTYIKIMNYGGYAVA